MTDSRGWVIHRYGSVASTMDVAARLARFGAQDRSAVVATEQTAGRGRAGRVWQAPPSSSLFCTLILRPDVAPDRLSTLPLVTGVAVAEAIEALTGVLVQLKWPNDVWIGADPERRKVAGILTTSALTGGHVDFALAGIGINVAATVDQLPQGATSISAATGARIAADHVLLALLAHVDRAYEAFLASAIDATLAKWQSRAALLGTSVTVEEAGDVRSGVFIGIDDDGALLLQDSNRDVRRIVSGELARGPQMRSPTIAGASGPGTTARSGHTEHRGSPGSKRGSRER